MTDFKSAFKDVKKLSADFKANERHYLSPGYSEADVRKDYIDKFFTALGWDVNHNIQKNPYEQEVKVEKTQSNQKRTDYTFFLSPNFKDAKFFVEAKKPQRNLYNKDDYFQTIRYGWNANTPIAVLTDFEEFHILDCRFKPDINSVLQNKNHKQYHYSDYADLDKLNEIYFLFSQEAIADDSLKKYSDTLPKPKGKAPPGTPKVSHTIDEDFLVYIDKVRENLAKSFKKNDANLSSEELTEATQRTIDRLVFIRFLEDKLIEPDNYVSEFGKKGNAWNDFISLSQKLNAKYNGIVFKKHFIDEQNFKGSDKNEFDKICKEISHLNSPYDFNAIPIHILGSIYERFLGKVVHATDKRVKVEEKPEVRKVGGVYYTPKYIVDYIVQNTVGKLIKGKTPEEISRMHFADIACGSGSFLIGVFECLLNYHNEYYQSHPDKAKKDGCLEKDGMYILSIKQKQNILHNNVFGVDIDQQATEVTQLSLALKMLEDETTATANDMQVLFHEKILPDLSKNIVCGNSLIGTDILSNNMFESEEERKLNPMDFENVFPEIMRKGGFDAIVGNPPYGAELDNMLRTYLERKSKLGNTDTAALFLINARRILKNSGKTGYIIPKSFTYASNWAKTRNILLSDIIQIIDCSRVWNDVRLEMCIFISDKNSLESSFLSFIRKDQNFIPIGKIKKELCEEFGFILNGVNSGEVKIGFKLKSQNKSLNDFAFNQRGCIYQNKISEKGDFFVLGGKQINKYFIEKDKVKGMLK
ncbi:Eco57I restriction-modification methylase domain-containing protein, partial [Bacteroidota bacterium]